MGGRRRQPAIMTGASYGVCVCGNATFNRRCACGRRLCDQCVRAMTSRGDLKECCKETSDGR